MAPLSPQCSKDCLSNPSFAKRESTPQQSNFLISRSTSSRDLSFSELFTYNTPPRFSFQNHYDAISLTNNPLSLDENHPINQTLNLNSSYRCIYSVFKRRGGHVMSLAVRNDIVYVGSDTDQIRIWKLPGFKECERIRAKASTVVALEVVYNAVFAAYGDGKIRVWRRVWDGTVRHVRSATIPKPRSSVLRYISGKDNKNKHMAPITSLAVNARDDLLYSASMDCTVRVWRLSDFECIETIRAHSQPVNSAVVSMDGVLFTASDDSTVGIWRRNFCRVGRRVHALTHSLNANNSPVKTLALTPTTIHAGGILYGGCTDGYVHYWTTSGGRLAGCSSRGGEEVQYGGALRGHTHAVMCVATMANYVASGSADATCRVWMREDDGRHTCVAVLAGHQGPIRCVAAIPGRFEAVSESEEDGCMVCTGSVDGVLKVWRITQITNSDRRVVDNDWNHFKFS